MKPINYLKVWLLSLSTVSLCFAFFNGLIDPYRVVGSPEIKGLNQLKPEFSDHLRLAKAAIVNRLAPKAIILGSSRAEQAYDTNHPGWNLQAQPRYNLGLAAVSLYELLRYFQHAHKVQPLEQTVVGLDFYMFNAYRASKPDFSEKRLAVTVDNQPNFFYRYHDMLPVFLSEDGLTSSLNTIRQQKSKNKGTPYLNNGQRAWKHKPEEIVKGGGYEKAFAVTENIFVTTLYLPPPDKKYSFINTKTGENYWEYYRTLLRIAYEDNIDFRLIINPSHARQWEIIRHLKLWDKFEEWKWKLVKINEEEAAKFNTAPFPIWDFSGYNEFTTETVPDSEDKTTKMQWYYESSHFSKPLGDLVLNKVFDSEDEQPPTSSSFGVLLTSENIESHLSRIRAEQQEYEKTNQEDVMMIKKLVDKYYSESDLEKFHSQP
ncbi:hypothetical protein [Crocosphaera sp.]|uniref:hypothetical protein n=1 Tax=Crocosphaera sp. TaxID=2729996 RepID=UPI003F239D78|nr:hypothetical protein [Crocosphaera sp.]